MTAFIIKISILVKSYGMAGVFLNMVLENIGIPLPTEVGFLVARDLVIQKAVSFSEAILIITLGHQVGSLISYSLGRYGEQLIIQKFRQKQGLQRAEKRLKSWYQKYGLVTVLLGRFIGYIRPWSSFLAGLGKIPFWPFFFLTLLGSLFWNYIQMLFSGILILIWQKFSFLHWTLGIVLSIAFLGFFIYQFWKSVRK